MLNDDNLSLNADPTWRESFREMAQWATCADWRKRHCYGLLSEHSQGLANSDLEL